VYTRLVESPKKKRLAIFLASVLAATPALHALTPEYQRSVLGNGLETAFRECGASPVVAVRAVFRAGAIAQDAKNAGIFALYASLVAEGNSAYPTVKEFRAALSGIGASGWEASSTEESASFGFTLPASRLAEGLAFLARAVSEPSFPAQALDAAKARAADTAKAAASSPEGVYAAAISSRLFPRYPFRRDSAGSPEAIAGISRDDLLAIRAKYFIPNNCLLVGSGGAGPDAFQAAAEAGFGAWARGNDPWKAPLPAHPLPPVKRSAWLIYEDPGLSEGEGVMEMRYRGPDAWGDPKAPTTDPKGLFAGLLLRELAMAPESAFRASVARNVPGVAGPERVSLDVSLSRDGGEISVSAAFDADASMPAWQRAMMRFKEQVRGVEFEAMRRDPAAYFGKGALETAKAALEGALSEAASTPQGFIGSYARIWAAGPGLYDAWTPSAEALNAESVRAFIFKYVSKNLEIVALRLSPADYAREEKDAVEHGFSKIGSGNAFWWGAK
jgi:zinc protease